MCRAGGRRCEAKWDNAHRERYNARRRIVRNSEKASVARAHDDEGKATYYDTLVGEAREVEHHHSETIRAHEAESSTEADYPMLDSLNPTGTVFTEYSPEARANAALGPDITTLAETQELDPDSEVTVYRGTPKGAQSQMNAGDFITTNKMLAQDYAGTGEVIEQKVRARDILDSRDEPGEEEYIYRPGASGGTSSSENADS